MSQQRLSLGSWRQNELAVKRKERRQSVAVFSCAALQSVTEAPWQSPEGVKQASNKKRRVCVCVWDRERKSLRLAWLCRTRKANRNSLTLNTGTARPGEGVQPRKEGARLAQHACPTTGDIIELMGAHSQSLHTVKHVIPHPPQPRVKSCSVTCVLPCLRWSTHQQQLSRLVTFLCLRSLICNCHCALFSCQCRVCFFPVSAGMQIWFLPGWAELSVTLDFPPTLG